MKAIRKAYDGIKEFVDNFSNSTTHQDYSPRPKENAPVWYAAYDKSEISAVLENSMVKKCLQELVNYYYGDQYDAITKEATELTSSAYPSLYAVYDECCKRLDVFDRPKAFITNAIRGINALSLEVNQAKIILISRMLPAKLNCDEQAFVLGHELGHHLQGNLVGHTANGLLSNLKDKSVIIGTIISDMVESPLKRWCRHSEFNADRAGLVCCGNMDTVLSVFAKVTERKRRSPYSNLIELYEDHPLVKTRMDQLMSFNNTRIG